MTDRKAATSRKRSIASSIQGYLSAAQGGVADGDAKDDSSGGEPLVWKLVEEIVNVGSPRRRRLVRVKDVSKAMGEMGLGEEEVVVETAEQQADGEQQPAPHTTKKAKLTEENAAGHGEQDTLMKASKTKTMKTPF